MLIFESTKTNTPIPQQDLAPILKSPPHTYVRNHGNDDHGNKWGWHTKHIQTKANTDKLCETMQNQRYSPIKKKQCNLGIRFEPFLLLEFSPPLESCSDICAGPTICLIVTLLFNVLFLWYFPLFFLSAIAIVDLLISVLCTQIECSLLSIIARHAPLLLIGYKCVLGLCPTLWSKMLSAPLIYQWTWMDGWQ